MKYTQIIVGAMVVIATTLINSSEGIPMPQNFMEVDGFVFDGQIDKRIPSTSIKSTPVVVPTAGPSTGMQAPTTDSPEVAQCIQNCQVTSEYNPVCGTDRNVYSNRGRLNCAKACGRDVDQAYYGPCNSAIRG